MQAEKARLKVSMAPWFWGLSRRLTGSLILACPHSTGYDAHPGTGSGTITAANDAADHRAPHSTGRSLTAAHCRPGRRRWRRCHRSRVNARILLRPDIAFPIVLLLLLPALALGRVGDGFGLRSANRDA